MVIIPLITRRSILMDILMQELLVFRNDTGEGVYRVIKAPNGWASKFFGNCQVSPFTI